MRRRTRLALALLAFLAIGGAAFVLLRLNTRTYPPAVPSGELTFTVNARGHWDIAAYTAESGLTILTPDDGFQDYFASWDFSGQRINYLANRTPDGELGPTQIYADGSNMRSLDILSAVTTLLLEGRIDWDPVYSADGTLAWASLRDLNLELYMRAADAGAEPQRLTNGGARDWFPAWSPDGRYLAFASDRAGNEDVYLYDTRDQSTVQVTGHPADDTRPLWSLDGTQLLFISERDGDLKDGTLNFYLIETAAALAGEGDAAVTALDPAAPFEGDPHYSPDGRQIALTARIDGKWAAQVMDIDSDNAIIRESAQTITADGNLLFPVWRPSAAIDEE